MTTAEIRALFSPDLESIYLDAATYGLPPGPTVAALDRALREWQAGTAVIEVDWEPAGEACRALFAELIGAAPGDVALIPTVSIGVGMVAASLPEGAEVLVPEDEFTSVVLPFLAAAARGVTVREVPWLDLAAGIRDETALVAFSLTRAQSGETADLGAVCAAARAHGCRVLVDSTHATPFVEVADHLARIDYLVCHAYKHLLSPRGVGFLYVHADARESLTPYFANWRTSGRSYGDPLSTAPGMSPFDVSLAWQAWVGARESLALLVQWRREGALDSVLGLSRRLATGLEVRHGGASLVCVPVADPERAATALGAAGIRCAARGGFIRLSPHVYNT
ncbi:MAG: aminotransferase class V-fold PLP-dependent enzyme, partial [Thermomicrobiales bacterium]